LFLGFPSRLQCGLRSRIHCFRGCNAPYQLIISQTDNLGILEQRRHKRGHVENIDVHNRYWRRGAAEQTLASTLDHFGRVQILVNNAGVQRRHPAAEFPLADWDAVLAVNLRSVFSFCQAFGQEMLRCGSAKLSISHRCSASRGLYDPGLRRR
jgi:NAD(P)-dependent dehydrogenase (short-subunit alcohol dehydrogenase family)